MTSVIPRASSPSAPKDFSGASRDTIIQKQASRSHAAEDHDRNLWVRVQGTSGYSHPSIHFQFGRCLHRPLMNSGWPFAFVAKFGKVVIQLHVAERSTFRLIGYLYYHQRSHIASNIHNLHHLAVSVQLNTLNVTRHVSRQAMPARKGVSICRPNSRRPRGIQKRMKRNFKRMMRDGDSLHSIHLAKNAHRK
jgi:hypothetical protein